MKKKLFIAFVLGILVSSLWIFKVAKKTPPTPQQSEQKEGETFCVPIHLAGFTSEDLPYVKIEIENQEFFFLIDLGWNGDAAIFSEYLPQIQDKTFVTIAPSYNFRGKEYHTGRYKIPQLKLNECIFSSLMLIERTREQEQDTSIGSVSPQSTPPIAGKLGWTLFNSAVVCFDLKFSKMAVSDSLETIRERLPLVWDRFSKSRMLDDNDLVEIETLTSTGPLRCVLDTGCTFNILNTENPTDKPLEEIIDDEEHFIHFQSFQIGDKDFGPMEFCPIPVRLPFHVEAILGSEFFLEHTVIIDFPNRWIYIAPSVVED